MEAAHSQHVSLLSQCIKLAHILSATPINHHLPLYKPAAERSTLHSTSFLRTEVQEPEGRNDFLCEQS